MVITEKPGADIYRAVCALSAACDGARQQDGAGFNALDSAFGKSLASRPFERWTPKQFKAAHNMLRTYKNQLKIYGFDYNSFIVPEDIPQTQETRLVSTDGEFLYVTFPKDERAQVDIRKLGKWDHNKTAYRVPIHSESCRQMGAFVKEYNYYLGDGVRALMEQTLVEANRLLESSRAATSTFNVSGMKLPLRPFQRAGVEYLVTNKKCILADQYGIGKTPQALAALFHLQSYPAIVFCPKSVKNQWYEEAQKFCSNLDPSNLIILNGKISAPSAEKLIRFIAIHRSMIQEHGTLDVDTLRGMSQQEWTRVKGRETEFDPIIAMNYSEEFARRYKEYVAMRESIGHDAAIVDAKLIIINYDIVKAWLPVLRVLGHKAIVGDEIHMCKSPTATRSKAVRELAQGCEYVFLLSGSPLLNRPEEFISYLQILDVLNKEWGGWRTFVTQWLGGRQGRFGWEFDNFRTNDERAKTHMALNRKLRSDGRFIRRVKRDTFDTQGNLVEKGVAQDELPSVQTTTVMVDLDNMKEYERAEDDVIQFVWQRAREDKEYRQSIAHLPFDEQEKLMHEWANSKAQKAKAAEHLTKMNVLRQLADRGKKTAVAELAANLRDANESFLIFGWFTDTVNGLAMDLKMPAITGGTSEVQRENYRKSFQSGILKSMALNIRAGGVGLTLTGPPQDPCSNLIFAGLDWSPTMLGQAEGRNDRIGTGATMLNIWYVLGRDTIDEELWKLLQSKRSAIDTSVDGFEGQYDPDVLGGITDWLMKKGRKKYGGSI